MAISLTLTQRSVILPVGTVESVHNVESVHVIQDGMAISANKVHVIWIPSNF